MLALMQNYKIDVACLALVIRSILVIKIYFFIVIDSTSNASHYRFIVIISPMHLYNLYRATGNLFRSQGTVGSSSN